MEYDPKNAQHLLQPEMPDPAEWIMTLERFVSHIHTIADDRLKAGSSADECEAELTVSAPIDATTLSDLSNSLPYELPHSLHDFFTHGAAEITFRFAFDLGDDAPEDLPEWICGGELEDIPGPLFSAEKLSDYVSDAYGFAGYSWISQFPEVQQVWQRSLPFFRFNNADFLALDPIDDQEDPYVIHLDHGGEPRLVSRNLASFLIEWPRVCYVGPGDINDLEWFIDQKTGVLSGDISPAVSLRTALQWTP